MQKQSKTLKALSEVGKTPTAFEVCVSPRPTTGFLVLQFSPMLIISSVNKTKVIRGLVEKKIYALSDNLTT
jgi:hypothetical protein